MKTSSLFSLDFADFVKGLVVATGGAVLAACEAMLQSDPFNLNWKKIGSVALAAGLSYLIKNFFTPAKTMVKAER